MSELPRHGCRGWRNVISTEDLFSDACAELSAASVTADSQVSPTDELPRIFAVAKSYQSVGYNTVHTMDLPHEWFMYVDDRRALAPRLRPLPLRPMAGRLVAVVVVVSWGGWAAWGWGGGLVMVDGGRG